MNIDSLSPAPRKSPLPDRTSSAHYSYRSSLQSSLPHNFPPHVPPFFGHQPLNPNNQHLFLKIHTQSLLPITSLPAGSVTPGNLRTQHIGVEVEQEVCGDDESDHLRTPIRKDGLCIRKMVGMRAEVREINVVVVGWRHDVEW